LFLNGCGAVGLNECPIAQEADIPGEPAITVRFSYNVFRGSGSICIEWSLMASAEGDIFSVQRSPASRRTFREISRIETGPSAFAFKYLDLGYEPGKSYRYRVVYRSVCGTSCLLFDTGEYVATAIPTVLHPNRPNPFDAFTELQFSVGERVKTSLAIYDVKGRLVRVLVNSAVEPGSYMANWNGWDSAGRLLSNGVYFCHLRAGRETISRKLILMRQINSADRAIMDDFGPFHPFHRNTLPDRPGPKKTRISPQDHRNITILRVCVNSGVTSL